MTVSSGVIPAIELRTEDDIHRFFGRRRSDRQLVPQPPQSSQRVLQAVDRRVERAQLLPTLDGGAEVSDHAARLGRLLAASIHFVMRPARVRG